MKILYFSRDYTVHDHRFLSALARTPHEIYFLRLERGKSAQEERSIPDGIQTVSWAGGNGPARWQDAGWFLMSLGQVIAEVQPDLVHAGPIQRSALLVALMGFRPLVSMSWGYDLIFDARRNAAWRWATRYTLKHSAVMVGDCGAIRQLAISYGMPDEQIITFPWGIDLDHYRPAARQQTSNEFTILSTRGWEPIYGVDIIARAFVQAARQMPELRLVMLGSGSQAALLQKIFSEAGMLDKVQFPGLVGYSDLPSYYQSADLYVSASHSDGTSISLLESLACGIPALVSDIPGNREWVEPGVQGWWFPDGDVQALSQAFIQAAASQDHLPEMGSAARSLAESRADWNKNFPHLLDAYELAVSVKTGAR